MAPYGHAAPVKRTEAKAVVSLFLGLASFVFGPATGIPAIIVGSVARRDIARSNGMLRGGSLARGGTLAGLFGMGSFAVIVLWLGSALFVAGPGESAKANVTLEESKAKAKVTAPAAATPHARDVEPLHVSAKR